MTAIRIAEVGLTADQRWDVTVTFDGGGQHRSTVADPLAADPERERLLAWYFEEHLRYPFLDRDFEHEAVDLVTTYGVDLFNQLFAASEGARYEFHRLRDQGFDGCYLEVVGSLAFQRLHWEALCDPGQPMSAPLSIRLPVVRRVGEIPAGFDVADGQPSLNVLVVTARPGGRQDVGPRTVSRPLLAALRRARIPVNVELVRPGTWSALQHHLQDASERHGTGWYRIVHFDVHGAIAPHALERATSPRRSFGDDATPHPSDTPDAHLFFETARDGEADPVSTDAVAALLVEHRIPVAVMNACQSAMNPGDSEASLAQRLVEAGVPVALGMAYSVTVSAAQMMMPVIYGQLADGRELLSAVHAGRRQLFASKARRAYFDQDLDLEDWLLPVLFWQRPVEVQPGQPTLEQQAEIFERQARMIDEPQPEYGFVGRDLDVQAIERHLLSDGSDNELLIRGMAGAGKSTLLEHVGWWWQATGLVGEVLRFSYEDRAWTVEQMVQSIASTLLDSAGQAALLVLSADAQVERIATLLRSERHLLVIDNAESITAAPASIPHAIDQQEQDRLRRFLIRLRGGRTLVLVGSRGPEQWLDRLQVYELGGLDPQAASDLVERILTRHGATRPTDPVEREALTALIDVLGGYPLALTVVLPAVTHAAPSQVLNDLRSGGESADPAQLIQRAIELSHGRLDPALQHSLTLLAPFTAVVSEGLLDQYLEMLTAHDVVQALGPIDLRGALEQAIAVGLARRDTELRDVVRLHPTLPYFLRTRLIERPDLLAASVQAHYEIAQLVASAIYSLLMSQEAAERALGRAAAQAEYANLQNAFGHAVSTGQNMSWLVQTLEEYLDQTRNQHARRALIDGAIAAMSTSTAADREPQLMVLHNLAGVAARAQHRLEDAQHHHGIELELALKLDYPQGAAKAYHQLGLIAQERRRFEEAEKYYLQSLELELELENQDGAATSYHALGLVSQMQRRFDQAEKHYLQSLDLALELDDRRSAASCYHQLGTVTLEQNQPEQAEDYHRKALDIFLEFEDHHAVASTFHQLGVVALVADDLDGAETHYRRALQIFLNLNDHDAAATTYYQLGRAAHARGRLGQAEEHYNKSIELKLESADHHTIGRSYHQLGMVAEDQKDFDLAESRYRLALEHFSRLPGDLYSVQCYSDLGWVAARQGKLEQAEEHYRTAYKLLSEAQDLGRDGLSRRLGILLTDMGRPREALVYSYEALSAERARGNDDFLQFDLLCLSRQRQVLGVAAFREALDSFAGAEAYAWLGPLLDEVKEPEADPA